MPTDSETLRWCATGYASADVSNQPTELQFALEEKPFLHSEWTHHETTLTGHDKQHPDLPHIDEPPIPMLDGTYWTT